MSSINLVTHKGVTDTIEGWSKKFGIRHAALYQRLKSGWSVADALTVPVRPRAPNVKQRQPKRPAVVVTQFNQDTLRRQHLAMQRQFNSLLRQFNRDLHSLMGGGVVVDLLNRAPDRTTPVAGDLPEMVDYRK